MKEGYLQNKIRELDYKLKQQLELAEHLNRQLQLIIDSKKEYKAIFNKLKNLDSFKDKILKEIIKENQIKVQSVINESTDIINKHIHEAVEYNNEKIKNYVDRKIHQLQDKLTDKELVSRISKKIILNEQLCLILLEELVRERIFSNERVDIIQKRASIRAKKREEE